MQLLQVSLRSLFFSFSLLAPRWASDKPQLLLSKYQNKR